ncbi:MAG: NAD(P)-dependent oxidoreductase, partial [Marmoricola sp.]|nr:NAD(P)-dependent oxidoreductase [Marmoricola sp.]
QVLAASAPVVVFDRSAEARERAVAAGLPVAGDLTELARSANTVLLALTDAREAEEVLSTICPRAPGLLVLDTSPTSPEQARHLEAVADRHGSTYLDIPTTGGTEAIGGWTVLMGGPAAALRAVERILAPVAAKVVHTGDVGTAAAAAQQQRADATVRD